MSYTAAVLNEKSRNKLIFHLEELVPTCWELVAHHMTLHMGEPLPQDNEGDLVQLVATHVAKDENVIAVRISRGGHISSNKIPHITIAVNRAAGGKPVMSNNLTDWKGLNEVIDVPSVSLSAQIKKCG